MFQSRAIAAYGQAVVALIAAIIFPIIGLTLLQPALSIDPSDRPASAFNFSICFFVLAVLCLGVAVWRFMVGRSWSRQIEADGTNPILESYSDEDAVEQEKLERDIDEQTRRSFE